MTLPYPNITQLPHSPAPEAVPELWNTRYDEIDANFAEVEEEIEALAVDVANDILRWM